jgi:tripartite-type tricarboxylate transporter receptor subunit TctC
VKKIISSDLRATCAAIVLGALSVWTLVAQAQSAPAWPTRPVTLVSVFPPGGPVDQVMRIIAKGLSDELGQPFVVENRVGAGGTVGAASLLRAEADGNTVLGLISAHSAGETLYKARRYDLARDFEPVSLIGTSPNWLLVNAKDTRTASLRDLLAYARANPGKLTYASGGSGGLTHLSSELLKLQAGVDILHVPYKGNGPAITDLLAGRVDMLFDQPAASEQFVRSGQLRVIAVTSGSRLPQAPDAPTLIESGMSDFQVQAWYGLAVRAGTPASIIATLNAATVRVLSQPETRQRLAAVGITATLTTPQAFGDRIRGDIGRWRTVIDKAGITAQ